MMNTVSTLRTLFILILFGFLLIPAQAAEDANSQVVVESMTQLTFNGTGGNRPDWSPDGGKIVFDKWEGNQTNPGSSIRVINYDGTSMNRLISNSAVNEEPKWSPDGKKIVFSSRRIDVEGNVSSVWLMNSDGSNQKELKKGVEPVWIGDPAWTRENKISFIRCISDNNCEYIIMNIEGKEERKIFSKPFYFWEPTWSPDGTKIAFLDGRSGNLNIFVINSDGSNEMQLTDDIRDDWWPSWSPDGTKMVYHTFIQRHFDEKGNPKGADFDIMVMNSDGSNKIKLNTEVGFQLFPSWSPDGKKIAFSKMGDIWVMNLKSTEIPVPSVPASKPAPGFGALLAIACIGVAMVLRKR